MNRLTARKPLMMFIPHCCKLPLPVEYSIPHSKAQTTTLTVNNAHARREKKRTMALTHSSSNSAHEGKEVAEKAYGLPIDPVHELIQDCRGDKIPNKYCSFTSGDATRPPPFRATALSR